MFNGTFDGSDLAQAIELCPKWYVDPGAWRIYGPIKTSRDIRSKLSILLKPIDRCRVRVLVTRTTEIEKEMRQRVLDIWDAVHYLLLHTSELEKALSTGARPANLRKLNADERRSALEFLKLTGLGQRYGTDELVLNLVRERIQSNWHRYYEWQTKLYNLVWSELEERIKQWNNVLRKPDCPPRPITTKRGKRTPVTTHGGKRAPGEKPPNPNAGQTGGGETASAAPQPTPGHVAPKTETETGLRVFYVEGGVQAQIPINDPLVTNNQRLGRQTGWATSLAGYTDVWGNEQFRMLAGAMLFGSWMGNDQLINPLPFPSANFTGETDIWGGILFVGFHYFFNPDFSIRGYGGLGAASVRFTGGFGGPTLLSGQGITPAWRTGIAAFYEVAPQWSIGAGLDYTHTGSIGLTTNTGVPFTYQPRQDLTAGLYLRRSFNLRYKMN